MYVLQGTIPTLEDQVAFGVHDVTGFSGNGPYTATYTVPFPAGTEAAPSANFTPVQEDALLSFASGPAVRYSYNATNPTGSGATWNATFNAVTSTVTYRIGGNIGLPLTVQFPGFEMDLLHPLGVTRIYPADMCTWHTNTGPDGGYVIDFAEFWNGGSESTTSSTTPPVTTVTPVSENIANPQLGFIGKSGRFVQIAK